MLDNIVWNVGDINLEDTLIIGEKDYFENKEGFLTALSQISTQFNNLSTVIFLYPVGLEDKEVVETVKYNTKDLSTALEIFRAIQNHYKQSLIEDSIVDLNDIKYKDANGSTFEFKSCYPRYLTIREYNLFGGLEEVKPGIYYIKLKY